MFPTNSRVEPPPLPGGDPFIVTASLGRGRTVLVATDGSLRPSIQRAAKHGRVGRSAQLSTARRELLAYASGGQQRQWQQLAGAPPAGRLSSHVPVDCNQICKSCDQTAGQHRSDA
jgi:hypothetical protein